MTEATAVEKDAQADYEQFMKDSAEKRAEDSKAITDKEAAIANMEAELQSATDAKAGAENDLGALLEYIHSLHLECDWLLKYFDAKRRPARVRLTRWARRRLCSAVQTTPWCRRAGAMPSAGAERARWGGPLCTLS